MALDLLIDSPVQSGEFTRVIPLTPDGKLSHDLDVVADDAWALDIPSELIENYKKLVAEATALYQSHHYRDYHFLLTLSDQVAHFGLEHHESSDDRVDERSLLDDSARMLMAGLLPHEMTHSWNGKYRRPADLATPNYQVPMEDDLLWVYEGLTEYLVVRRPVGHFLTAVLSNNLLEACQRADEDNRTQFYPIVFFLLVRLFGRHRKFRR